MPGSLRKFGVKPPSRQGKDEDSSQCCLRIRERVEGTVNTFLNLSELLNLYELQVEFPTEI